MTDNKIRARFIFEILGKPPEHLKETLSQMIDKLSEINGVVIEEKIIKEPTLIEDEKVKDMYTTFADVEITSDSMQQILIIVFNMFPAHVEIIEPGEISMQNFEFTELLNDVISKLHRYDEVAKRLTIERGMFLKKIKELEESKTEDKK